jgi:kynurenine formamidase
MWSKLAITACAAWLVSITPLAAASEKDSVRRSKALVPSGPWPAGDERGMGNTQGAGTYLRCSYFLGLANAKTYELAHVRSNNMPLSPFGAPLGLTYKPTAVLPGSHHAFNSETYQNSEHGQQGTQFDALGHFAALPKPWDGQGAPALDTAVYYGGFKQAEVKPSAESPLLKLGLDKVPPIVSSAVLLDARGFIGKGKSMEAGQVVTSAHIEAMLRAQGLAWRGILPGDVVYVYTGWSDKWQDPDTTKQYYSMGPGLALDAAKYLGEKKVVAVGLDVPFIDPINDGQLMGKSGMPPTQPAGYPFAIHHHLLTQYGIHHLESMMLAELARDRVWTSCTMILPLREMGGSGSAVRPVSIGVAHKK